MDEPGGDEKRHPTPGAWRLAPACWAFAIETVDGRP